MTMANNEGSTPLGPSDYSLTFDTETTTTAEQRLRVGNYQLRKKSVLIEEGLFYDPAALSIKERRRLQDYARRHHLKLRTLSEFTQEIFYRKAYLLNALIISFNLPFDLSRLAIRHGSGKGKKMGGGFSLTLSENWPPVRIKHLSRTASLIDFASPGGQRTGRSWRKKNWRRHVRRGYFLDVCSLAAAITSGSHSLDSLGRLLGTAHQKTEAEHGQELTAEYLGYLRNDVQVTYECFEVLATRYESFKLTATPVSSILSEASIGKASLKEMGVKPWREVQPDFPAELTGVIMSSYFGGRSEVHLRRVISQVAYCDFLSTYPTVSVLQGLWGFVTAKGIDWSDATEATRVFVESLKLGDLAKSATWKKLAVLVQVEADEDLFPVRGAYAESSSALSIGLNYLSSDEPLWFTLADVLVSKLLTGKTPRIKKALSFTPRARQSNLKPIDLLGNSGYRIDPASNDFYLRLIEMRSFVKQHKRRCNDEPVRERLESEQLAMKIIANSSCYGIFVELNVQEYARKQPVTYFSGDEKARTANLASIEVPGRYFHPLVATLTTGAARLMLGIAQSLAQKEGLDWAFCDTDSMALARPVGMQEAKFIRLVEKVRGWFEQLNPYSSGDELFKLEDYNFELDASHKQSPLFCFPVSAKRYVLFNLGSDGKPILRKASAHGLGHLLAPYGKDKAPSFIPVPRVALTKIGVRRWQHDLWFLILQAALEGRAELVDLGALPGFNEVAASRYAATRPRLLKWFAAFNRGKPYDLQVHPFGFLNAYQTRIVAQLIQADILSLIDERTGGQGKRPEAFKPPRAVSPFDFDPAVAVRDCFDRDTGEAVPPEMLCTYREALIRYHLHPERKFRGGDYTDSGPLERRHIRIPEVNGIQYIGKEANRWEERMHTGEDPDAVIRYGVAGGSLDQLREQVATACSKFGVRRVARAAGFSHSTVLRFLAGESELQAATVSRLQVAIAQLSSQRGESDAVLAQAREAKRT